MKQAVLALVIIVSWTAPVAHAAPIHAPAVDHYQVGKRLFERKLYAEALEEFRQALLLTPRPEVLYSMAQTQRLLGDCPSAVSTYRAFLASRPGEPLAEYARANIARCEQKPTTAAPPGPAWYRDIVGDVLVGGGLVAGATGAVIWRSGRAAAMNLANAPDYQTFVARQSAASSALTEQRVGIAAMIVGGVAVITGVVHYVRRARSPRRESSLGIALAADSALITGRGTF